MSNARKILDDEEFANDGFGMLLKKELGKKLLSIKEEWGKWEICKLSCITESDKKEEIKRCELRMLWQIYTRNMQTTS